MIYLIFFFAFYSILQFSLLRILIQKNWIDHRKINPKKRSVSVLVSSRNETENLPALLKSFDALDLNGLEVDFWMVNDRSEDQTGDILKEWCRQADNRNYVLLREEDEGKFHINGKANALAFASHLAPGEVFFFTDSDCTVTPNWIKEALGAFPEDEGIMLGITGVMGESTFAKMQEVDWYHTLGIVKVMNDLGIGVTGLGNNMMIGRDALKVSGGFENLPGSLTEDLEISRQLIRSGFKPNQHVSPEILVKTKSEEPLSKFLKQRKRWLSGVLTLPFYIKVLLGMELAFYPAILFYVFNFPLYGIGIWLLKIIIQGMFLGFIARKSGRQLSWLHLFLFDFYQMFTALLSILYYFWPSKIDWKSRTYP